MMTLTCYKNLLHCTEILTTLARVECRIERTIESEFVLDTQAKLTMSYHASQINIFFFCSFEHSSRAVELKLMLSVLSHECIVWELLRLVKMSSRCFIEALSRLVRRLSGALKWQRTRSCSGERDYRCTFLFCRIIGCEKARRWWRGSLSWH